MLDQLSVFVLQVYQVVAIKLQPHHQRILSIEEDQKSCTEKLQVWHQSKPERIDAQPTNLIMLMKKVYGV